MKKEWFENEKFWVALYPYMFPPARFERSSEEVDKILQLTGCKKGSALDLCCGPGRHSVALAKKGFRVTGVDRTKFLLDKAKRLARAKRVKVEWVLEDMKHFARPETYNLIINMFTAFGYFDKKEDDLRVLQNMRDSLKSGGICVIDVLGKERLIKNYQETTSSRKDDGTLLIERHEIFDDWSRIRNEWILIKNGKTQTFHFHHTVYSGEELKDRMLLVGFKRVKLLGDLDGNEYGIKAKRLVAVGWKN
jgi:SAM-dependent methyltransferase